MTIDDRSNEFDTCAAGRQSREIRSGIRFPDWSVVRSSAAEAALEARLALRDFDERWRDYGEAEDRVRIAILRRYTTLGRAPTTKEIQDMTGIVPSNVHGILERLRKRDLIVLDASKDHIVGAYPFAERDTGHHVLLGGLTVNAMCAIDALGIGVMIGRDIAIASRCWTCLTPIRVAIRARGTAITSCDPEGAVVWSALNYADGCGATSSCATTTFFCSDTHLDEWRASNPSAIRGHRLSIEEAHEVGVAIFGPLLATKP